MGNSGEIVSIAEEPRFLPYERVKTYNGSQVFIGYEWHTPKFDSMYKLDVPQSTQSVGIEIATVTNGGQETTLKIGDIFLDNRDNDGLTGQATTFALNQGIPVHCSDTQLHKRWVNLVEGQVSITLPIAALLATSAISLARMFSEINPPIITRRDLLKTAAVGGLLSYAISPSILTTMSILMRYSDSEKSKFLESILSDYTPWVSYITVRLRDLLTAKKEMFYQQKKGLDNTFLLRGVAHQKLSDALQFSPDKIMRQLEANKIFLRQAFVPGTVSQVSVFSPLEGAPYWKVSEILHDPDLQKLMSG